jgi:hypothetical protein
MGVTTPTPQVKTSAPPPITSNVTDLSSQYANVNGTIYNKSTGDAYSTPQQFFSASGQNSFNNLKFDTSWTPPTSTLAGLQMPGTGAAALPPAGSTGGGSLGTSAAAPAAPATPASSSTPAPVVPTPASAATQLETYTDPTNPINAQLLAAEQAQQAQQAKVQSDIQAAGTQTADSNFVTGEQQAIQNTGNIAGEQLSQNVSNLEAQQANEINATSAQAPFINPTAVAGAGGGSALITPSGQTVATTSGLTQNLVGAPTAVNPSTGLIGAGATGSGLLGSSSTPTSTAPANVSSAVSSVLTSLGANDPASNSFITSAVQQALANDGNPPTSLTSQQAQVVKQVLSQMTGGAYSSTASAINLANQTAQSSTAQAIVPIAKTALSNLSALQNLSNLVGYSNSPITNEIRNQLSGTAFTDPSITNLQSAIGVVAGELGQVLGGGDATVSALNNAANSLPAGNISPQTLQGLITTLTTLVNNRLTELQSPSNTVTVPNGLSMPSGYSASSSTSAPSASSLDLSL